MAGRKRKFDQTLQQCAAAAASSGCAALTMLEAMSEQVVSDAGRVQWARKLSHRLLHAIRHAGTPYGNVAVESSVAGPKGTLTVDHVCPAALLYHLCSASASFFSFLRGVVHSVADGTLDIVMYLDKAKPGNERRPDDGRSCQCLYFTFLQYPDWFRKGDFAWLPFAYVKVADQKSAGVTDSHLVRFMTRSFLGSLNCVGLQSQGEFLQFRARPSVLVADWEQHVRAFNHVGFNGSVPCGWCRNVLGRCPFFRHAYLVHVNSAEYDRMDSHTPESKYELARDVQACAQGGGNLAHLQQSTGIKWDPEGVLWDDLVRSTLRPPWCEYPDWMHVYVASGGVAQYEINELVNLICGHGITKHDIDAWCSQVTAPRNSKRLGRRFFADRVVMAPGKHLKGFAAEALSAIVVLGLFIDIVVAPQNIPGLQRALDCFALLRVILAIFQRGCLGNIPTLQGAMRTHHELFASLYPMSVKRKMHQQKHLPEFWIRWNVLLSCFGPERHHKVMKRVHGYAFNKSPKTVLASDLQQLVKGLGRSDTVEPYSLRGCAHACNAAFLTSDHILIQCTAWALLMNSPTGQLAKGDLLQWRENGLMRIGFALGFARTGGAHPEHVAFARACTARGPSTWGRQGAEVCVVQAPAIVGNVFFADIGGEITPALLYDS